MSATAEQLKEVLITLPYCDRAELANFLMETLDAEIPPPEPLTNETLDETLNRRLKEILDGTAVGVPAFEGIERLRRKYS